MKAFWFLFFSQILVTVALGGMLQDNWYYNGLKIPGKFGAITIGPDWNIYAVTNKTATATGPISVFATNATFVRQFGTNMSVSGIALDSQTNIYVTDFKAKVVNKFDSSGNLLLQFSFGATNTITQNYSQITIGKDDRLYVADGASNRVRVFDTSGSLLTQWTNGSVNYYFSNLLDVATMPNGQIAVRNSSGNNVSSIFIFSPDGVFVRTNPVAASAFGRTRSLAVTSDGFFTQLYSNSPPRIEVYGSLGETLFSGSTTDTNIFLGAISAVSSNFTAIACDPGSTFYLTAGTNVSSAAIFVLNRIYGTDPPLNLKPLPLPTISSVKQRSGTPLIDIDYTVLDGDSPNVSVGILAFQGSETLDNLIKLTSLAENTSTNLGTNISANVTHRVTWDASQGVTNFATLQFEILSKDDRGLLPLHFITLPTAGTNSSLTMSRKSVSDSDLLNVWYWLLAANDSAITFTNQTIVGVGGAYDQLTLASGTSTTGDGRNFLYQRLNVRAPTSDEITRAQNGNFGFISVDGNSVVKP